MGYTSQIADNIHQQQKVIIIRLKMSLKWKLK